MRDRVDLALDPVVATTAAGGAAGEMGKGVNQRAKVRMSDAEVEAFLAEQRTISLATLNADGTIHLVAMWYGFLDGKLAFETKAKSQKVANLRRNPTITCMVESGTTYNELKGVQIVGSAEIFDERERMLEMGISVFERNVGPYTDEMLPAVEMMLNKRVGIVVHPQRVASWDHTKL
jgi:PPOX class probable F420-dependent enzyme